MNRWLLAALTMGAVASAPVVFLACSSDDETPKPVAGDAAADVKSDVDVCDLYTGVGKPCSLPPGKMCFAQCANGGCFCQGGVWACRTDLSCFPDGSPLDDAGIEPPLDAAIEDASGDSAVTDAESDATSDAAGDGPSDAADSG